MPKTLEATLTAGVGDDARPWSRRASSAGKTDLFYPAPGERPEACAARELRASLVCASCPVVIPCRDWARKHLEYGYWGGESEEARIAAGFRVRFPSLNRQAKRADPDRAA